VDEAGAEARSIASSTRPLDPIRSISVIVIARNPVSRMRARSAGSSGADSEQHDAARVDEREREPLVREAVARQPERGGERHPVHVARRARLGCVEIAVRVDPDHPARLARRCA
jgi:hypothetical protein